MIGTYQTIDNCRYRVFYDKVGKPAKTTLMAICEKSTVRDPPFTAFVISEYQIERNVRHNCWTKNV